MKSVALCCGVCLIYSNTVFQDFRSQLDEAVAIRGRLNDEPSG